MATHYPGDQDPLFNPFEAPKAELRSRPAQEMGRTSVPFAIGAIYSRAWALFQARMGLTVLAIFGAFALNLASQMVAGMVGPLMGVALNDPLAAGVVTLALTVAMVVFQLWINVGQSILLLKIARDEPASFNDLFSGGRFILTWVLAVILLWLAMIGVALVGFVPGVVAGAAMGGDPTSQRLLAGLGLGVGILGIVYLSLRVSQFYYIIVDRGAGALESLRLSARLTSGKTITILAVLVLTVPINLAGALAVLIGLVFTIPFTLLVIAVMYTALVGKPASASADPLGWRAPRPIDEF